MPIDSSRFVYSLAGRLIAGEWHRDELHASARGLLEKHLLRVPKLAERIVAAFPEKPPYGKLVVFMHGDAGLTRAMLRADSGSVVNLLRRLRSRIRRKPGADERPPGLRGISLPQLRGEGDIVKRFGIELGRLHWLADISGRNRKHPEGPLWLNRYRWIPRPGRFPRLLEIPKVSLKKLQREILSEILDLVPVHPACHGFCAGRSIVTNAAVHCGKPTVLRFDLRDFFPSITSARVFSIFRTIGYPPDVARIFTGVCTTQLPAAVWDARPGARDGADFVIRQRLITRHLPQGAPTSPALANLAAHRLDRRLWGLAQATGAAYTRYADDLTFSGGPDLARSRQRFGDHVALIAHEEGFSLNFRKTRILRAGVRQQITGVVVNAHPNIGRDEFDRLKAILTNCVRHGPESQNRDNIVDFRAHLTGKVAHVTAINPVRGDKLARIFRQILWDA